MRLHLPLCDNLKAAEIAEEHGMSVELNFDTRKLGADKEEIINVREGSRGIARSIHGPFMDLNAGALDEEVRRLTLNRFRWAIDTTRQLEVADLVLHDGYIPLIYGYPPLRTAWLQRAGEIFNEVSKLAIDTGIRVLVENMFTDDPLVIKALIDGTELKACLDVGHLAFSSNKSIKEWLSALGPFIKEIHVHDNGGRSDEHLALGAGAVDFGPVASFTDMFTLEMLSEADVGTSIDYLRGKGWI